MLELTTTENEVFLALKREVEAYGKEYPLQYYIDAARGHHTLEEAKEYLMKPCEICMDDYPYQEVWLRHTLGCLDGVYNVCTCSPQMVTMPSCIHSLCKVCFKQHFTITIMEKMVKHFNCPLCGEPDLSEWSGVIQGNYPMLFVYLVGVSN